jgi:hypothetical protein
MDKTQIDYICKHMLGTEWRPNIDQEVLHVLDKCQSKLEIMYLLGAAYFIDQIGQESGHGWDENIPLRLGSINYEGNFYEGIWFLEPWSGWYLADVPVWAGPSALMFVPQLEFGENIHHDFGVFYGNDNGSPIWDLEFVVEIDGYGIHKDRRKKDFYRDSIVPYRVIRLYEETHNPLNWFEQIVRRDIETLIQED